VDKVMKEFSVSQKLADGGKGRRRSTLLPLMKGKEKPSLSKSSGRSWMRKMEAEF